LGNHERKIAGQSGAGDWRGEAAGRAVALRLAEEGADVVVHYGTSATEAAEVVGKI